MNTYQMALSNLDSDGPQYITSNTLDEVSHAAFLNAYLEFRGAESVNLDRFRTLQGSTATGSSGIKRLTNLMNLNVDTSWFVRYRSTTNPDLGATFPQAIALNGVTANPRTNADFNGAPIGNNLLGNLHTQLTLSLRASLGRTSTAMPVPRRSRRVLARQCGWHCSARKARQELSPAGKTKRSRGDGKSRSSNR
jgi:hypothetical protein